MNPVLYTIVHNNLRYAVNTDHLCDYKLWIKVYNGDNMLFNIFAWLRYENGQVLDSKYGRPVSWKDAAGFNWYGLNDDRYLSYFTEEVQKKLDSYFKLKAFW